MHTFSEFWIRCLVTCDSCDGGLCVSPDSTRVFICMRTQRESLNIYMCDWCCIYFTYALLACLVLPFPEFGRFRLVPSLVCVGLCCHKAYVCRRAFALFGLCVLRHCCLRKWHRVRWNDLFPWFWASRLSVRRGNEWALLHAYSLYRNECGCFHVRRAAVWGWLFTLGTLLFCWGAALRGPWVAAGFTCCLAVFVISSLCSRMTLSFV